MAVWRDRILAALAPCTDADMVEAAVGKLLLGFENGRQNAQATQARNGEYLTALEGLPLWAIMEAADRFRTGETLLTWNKAFRPTPPEFADEVREGLADLRRQQIQIRDVLDAEILPTPDPEAVERARQAARDAIAGKLMREQHDQRRAADAEEREREAILAGPPIKPGALGAAALGRFLPASPARRTSGQPAA
ncbi:hypothetical protein [Methylobacterium nonmethylotrophicum]|uniref:Uncharacterized protein n=1 Tax=Methylobacterium nonmethylotrophicum TaxID=1141884 RepID=A0A4Z0NN84_9HYPH|nr:hypothetical protein [Methylobacterium nonmethylotrophicum]TGD98087.1 hypothetical protein EU555_18250 [Methylobacterium nonmethylotrophicum]